MLVNTGSWYQILLRRRAPDAPTEFPPIKDFTVTSEILNLYLGLSVENIQVKSSLVFSVRNLDIIPSMTLSVENLSRIPKIIFSVTNDKRDISIAFSARNID